MDSQQATVMQLQLRQNSEDLQSFLRDLDSWEEEIKEKDEGLKRRKPILKEKLPPVRGQAPRPPVNGLMKKKRKKKQEERPADGSGKDGRITSFDYRAWDKFDVERACEEVDYKVRSSSSSEGEEEVEGLEDEGEELKRQQAILEKEKGNALFKEGQFELAVESYTRAMELDPLSAVLPANRAMALIKIERYAAAEKDCSMALALDDSYVKAYLRRGVARACLGQREEAREAPLNFADVMRMLAGTLLKKETDEATTPHNFQAVLKLEPGNKQARAELVKIEKLLEKGCGSETSKGEGPPGPYVSTVKRLPHLRSKKPLKRIAVEDLGQEESPPGDGVAKQTQPVKPEEECQGAAAIAAVADDIPDSDVTSGGRRQGADGTFLDTTVSTQLGVCKHDGSSGVLAPKKNDKSEDVSVKRLIDETCRQAEAASSSSVTAADGMVISQGQLPSVPETSLQFQTDWKALRIRDRALLSQYFKSLPPSKYPMLLQQSLETNTFPEIIAILHRDYIQCGKPCLEQLRWLTKVKRFSVSVMFLSRQEKESLLQLFRDLQAVLTDSEQTELNELAHQFCVKL